MYNFLLWTFVILPIAKTKKIWYTTSAIEKDSPMGSHEYPGMSAKKGTSKEPKGFQCNTKEDSPMGH